jgi:hypothetical protein
MTTELKKLTATTRDAHFAHVPGLTVQDWS